MTDLPALKELYSEAEKAGKSRDHKGALETLNKLIERGEEEVKRNGISTDERREMSELLALAYNDRGYVKYLQVDFDEAVVDYTLAIGHHDSLAVAYYNRGLIHYRLARFYKAIVDQEKVLSLQPDFTSARQCLEQSRKDMEERKASES